MKKLCFVTVASFAVYLGFIRGEDKVLNILNFENSDKYGKHGKQGDAPLNKTQGTEELNLLKKHLNEDNMEAALQIIESLKKDYEANKENIEIAQSLDSETNKKKAEGADANNMFQGALNMDSLKQMMKFYSYVQGVLNSKNETTEKKMVRSFLRKSFQNMKKSQAESDKQSIEDIIKKTEGHQEMLEKLAEIMQVDKTHLQDEETRNGLNQILVGILKFIDYTNNSNIVEDLLDEIEIRDVEEKTEEATGTEGNDEKKGSKKRLHVNLQNSKAHLEMLQKASDYMGLNISENELKKLTSENKWYQTYVNQILNYATDMDADDEL